MPTDIQYERFRLNKMSTEKKCRLCFTKLTRENATNLEENNLSELLIKIFPGINLKLTRCCKICRECYKKAVNSIQFQNFVYFKRRYYKEVRQLKLTKKMCHICFKDFSKAPRKLLCERNLLSVKFSKNTVEFALSPQIKFDPDAIFCQYCWTKANKIYAFKKNCFETEEMLQKELAHSSKNEEVTLKKNFKGVEKYLGEIEILKPPQTLVRSSIKENASKNIKNGEAYLTEVENSARKTNPAKQQTITTTVTTKEVTTTQKVFENEQEIIETTVVYYEEVDSDDDIFEEEEQEFSDTDDVFKEKSDPRLIKFIPSSLGINCTGKESLQNTNSHTDLGHYVNSYLYDENDSIIDLTDELDSRIKGKESQESIDINENNLNDEDIDDIFSEEECNLSDNEMVKHRTNNTFQEFIGSSNQEIKVNKESEVAPSKFLKSKTVQSSKNASKKTKSSKILKPRYTPKIKSEVIVNLQLGNKTNKKTNNAKSLPFPKAIYYPPKNCITNNQNTQVGSSVPTKMDVEKELPAFVAVDKTVTEQSYTTYQTSQKTVVSKIFQHTENTIQMTPFTKNNPLFEINHTANSKSHLEVNTYVQTDISHKASLQKQFSVVTDDRLSSKLLNNSKNYTKNFCQQECCSYLKKSSKKMVNKDRISIHRKNRQRNTEQTVLVGKLITKMQNSESVNKKDQPNKKRIKLPPLIPIKKTSSTIQTKTITEPKTKSAEIPDNKPNNSNYLVTKGNTTTAFGINQESNRLTSSNYDQKSSKENYVQNNTDNKPNNLNFKENTTTIFGIPYQESVKLTSSSYDKKYMDNYVQNTADNGPNSLHVYQNKATSSNYNQESNHSNFNGHKQISNQYNNSTNRTDVLTNYYVPNNNNTTEVDNNCSSYYAPSPVQSNYVENMETISHGQRSQNIQNNMNYCYGNNARYPAQSIFPAAPIQWSCHMCMAKFTQKRYLFGHMGYHVDSNFYWFYCKKCKFTTASMHDVQHHLSYCKMEENIIETTRENHRYVCHICMAEFSEKLVVHNHIQEHVRMIPQYTAPHMI